MDAETKSFIKEEIESLGIMIAKSFEYTGKQIHSLEGKVDALDGKVNALDGRMSSIEGRMSSIEGRMSSVEGEIKSLGRRMSSVENRLTTVETKIDRETEMLVVLENNLMDRDLAGEDRTQQVLHRVERIEDHLKLSHSLEPA